jgi:hypothetical protein
LISTTGKSKFKAAGRRVPGKFKNHEDAEFSGLHVDVLSKFMWGLFWVIRNGMSALTKQIPGRSLAPLAI